MPESIPEVPTGEGATDQGIGQAIQAVAAATYGIVSTVAAVELEYATNPCAGKTRLLTQLQKANRAVDRLRRGVDFWAGRNQEAVVSAIDKWGFAVGFSTGGVPFSAYLFNNAYTWYLAPRHQMPSPLGRNKPSSRNSGTWLSPGVYLRNGRLSGSRVVTAWYAWRRQMRRTVYAIGTGRPAWRDRLRSWVGTSRPESWRIWVPGDPIAEDSVIGRAMANRDLVAEAYAAAIGDCNQIQENSRIAATNLSALFSGQQPQAPLIDLGTENEEKEEKEEGFPIPIILGLGVAAFVMFEGLKR